MHKDRINESIPGKITTLSAQPLRDIDYYLLNPYTGYPIMLLCFTALFAASFTLGKPVSNWLGAGLDNLAVFFKSSQLAGALPAVLTSLVSDGLFRGIGSALAFFPQMLIFFIFYTVINETGYTARIAQLMQPPMSRLNMNANAFSCLIIGYSCNVPSIVSTRDMPRRLDRLLLMLLSTFTPCSARFGVILYITAVFFSPLTATLVMSGLIVLSLLVKGLIALVVKSRYPRNVNDNIKMTLPPLHKPSLSAILRSALYRTLDFLNKIKNVVIISSIVVWFLSSFPQDAGFEQSYAAILGKFLEPLGTLAGLNWQLIVALFLGFFAKETTLSTLGILFHASEGLGNLSAILVSHISPLAGLSFLVMFMFYTPCLATVATIRQESKSFLFAGFSVVFSLALAYFLGVLFYQVGSLLI